MKKKILFLFVCLLTGLSLVSYADETKTCKVKGTDGSVEVSVMVTDAAKGQCIISFSNDTERNVNVRYKVTCTTTNKDLVGSVLVYANSETTRAISFGKDIAQGVVKIASLTGEKCE